MTLINMANAKKQRKDEAYSRLVLKAWDDMDHDDKRKVLDLKTEIQIKGRDRL